MLATKTEHKKLITRFDNQRLLVFSLLMLVLFGATPSYAWNDLAHRAIAIAALRSLPAETQQNVLATLQKHPRYRQDFLQLQPKDQTIISSSDWLIGQAAVWPDIARGFEHERFFKRDALRKRYHRGNWHYINFPIYLDEADRQLNIPDPSVATDADPSEPHNVLAAMNFIHAAMLNPATKPADRGLWLAWALHLLADAHQPLHSSALFDAERWPRGDRGGNDQTLEEFNLHGFWDYVLLEKGGAKDIDALAQRLAFKGELSAQAVDVEGLLRDAHKLAIEVVYNPLLEQIRAEKQIELDAAYRAKAAAYAQRQGALAVQRTAQWLQGLFHNEGPNKE